MLIGRNHKLSAMPEGNFVFRAKFVKQLVAFDAKPRLQRILRIINSRVIHTAVARARRHPNLGILLDKKNILPALRNFASNRASDYTATDNQYFGLVHDL